MIWLKWQSTRIRYYSCSRRAFLSFELKDPMPFIVKGMIPVDFDSIEPRESNRAPSKYLELLDAGQGTSKNS